MRWAVCLCFAGRLLSTSSHVLIVSRYGPITKLGLPAARRYCGAAASAIAFWECGDDSLSRYDIYNISGDFDVVKEKSEGNKIFKICPNPKCGKRSLVINEKYNSYNCINPDCPDYGVPIFKYHKEHPQLPIDQIFQQQDKIEAEKKAQDESKEHPPSMFDEFIRQEKERIEAEKKALDESTAKARLWNGNQYWDEKKKKWRDGDQPIRSTVFHLGWSSSEFAS